MRSGLEQTLKVVEMEKSNLNDGKKNLSEIQKESLKRRASPLTFFGEFLQHIWMDNTDSQPIVSISLSSSLGTDNSIPTLFYS